MRVQLMQSVIPQDLRRLFQAQDVPCGEKVLIVMEIFDS
jgi:hypothetical protein